MKSLPEAEEIAKEYVASRAVNMDPPTLKCTGELQAIGTLTFYNVKVQYTEKFKLGAIRIGRPTHVWSVKVEANEGKVIESKEQR